MLQLQLQLQLGLRPQLSTPAPGQRSMHALPVPSCLSAADRQTNSSYSYSQSHSRCLSHSQSCDFSALSQFPSASPSPSAAHQIGNVTLPLGSIRVLCSFPAVLTIYIYIKSGHNICTVIISVFVANCAACSRLHRLHSYNECFITTRAWPPLHGKLSKQLSTGVAFITLVALDRKINLGRPT